MALFGLLNELKKIQAARRAGATTRRQFDHNFNDVLRQFCETADATQRFDLVLPVITYGRFSPFFWQWFNWWDDYFNTLPRLQIAHAEWMVRERDPSAAKFRPIGDWLRHRRDAAFTVVSE